MKTVFASAWLLCVAGSLAGATPKAAPTNAPAVGTNLVPALEAGGTNQATNIPPVLVIKGPPNEEKFLDWLVGMGADSNRVYQLRQGDEVKKLFTWFDEHGPAARNEHLLNGTDLSGFYTWLEKDGVYWDRDGVFTITNGMLRISGQHVGYLATKRIYSDYRLVGEFKWGELTWGKRKTRPRNSGICIHGVGLDKVWMKGIEVQVAEGQTGDVVVLDGAKLTANGVTKTRTFDTFVRPGSTVREDKLGFRAPDDLEAPHGEWNTVEVICQGSIIKVKINGKTVLDALGAWPNAGRILLQSNGAEIFYRKLDVHSLK
jgi:hypothetical protein